MVVGLLSHASFTFSLGCLVVSLGQAEARFTQHLVCQKIVVASSFRELQQIYCFLFTFARFLKLSESKLKLTQLSTTHNGWYYTTRIIQRPLSGCKIKTLCINIMHVITDNNNDFQLLNTNSFEKTFTFL